MAKSLVEKYEQILAQDPASTVFVELAKALIEKGDNARAIEVCQAGLVHHADSVVGRVLWGKALINLGRPAEAMEQFDQAIGIDRDNPHAYNLIGEVLLHKGLYRSALPLLRKAVALQPNDGRVRQWLEQTQAALAGGPAPVLADITQVDTQALPADAARDQTEVSIPAHTTDGPTGDQDAPDEASAPTEKNATIPPADPPTEVVATAALEPRPQARPQPKRRADGTEIPVLVPVAPVTAPASTHPADDPFQTPLAPPAEEDPFEAVPRRTSSSEVLGGLTATFDTLSKDGQGEERGPTVEIPVPTEPSISVDPGLLGELPPPPAETPAPAQPARAQNGAVPRPGPGTRAPTAGSSRGGGLLGDIPELPEPTSSLEVPKVEVSATAAEAIAREYERELRAKLAQSRAKTSFLSRHWLKLSAGGVALLVVVVGAIIYVQTLMVNQGSLQDALADAKKAVLQDTRLGYLKALEALARAERMDDEVSEIWALRAYASGILYAEHGRQPQHREAGLAALNRPGIRDQHPELALAASWYLAAEDARAEQAKTVLASPMQDAEVSELAGRLLLDRGDAKNALKRFQSALADQPSNARVLVALGEYYRVSGDFGKALEFYGTAKEISPAHPGRVIGAAESRLELEKELDVALSEVEGLPPNDAIPEPLRWRRVLVQGRLLAVTGQAEKAVALISGAAGTFKQKAYEFQIALGFANRRAGRMADAEAAYEAALKLRPKSEEAREGLGRVLVDRDRAREALAKVPADPESRKVSLVRGVAYAKLGDWKRARGELHHTRLNGKYPSEAVIQLALADSNEGQAARAIQVLEKVLAVSRKARSDVLVALGDIHLAKGELDKAKGRYEEASKEPDDVEGACAHGRLLLRLGFPELAIEPLARAAKRNDSHNEAHEALTRAYLQVGRVAEALEVAGRWKDVNPDSAAALRMYATALYQAGRLKEADAAATKAIRADDDSPEAWRIRSAVNFAQGDSRTAFRDLERANKLDPKDPDTFCEIGLAFLRQGAKDMATAAFSAAVRENKAAECGHIGLLYAKLPSATRSDVAKLEKLAKDAPAAWDKAFAHTARSRALLTLGRTKEAKEAAQAAVKLAPWSGPAHLALALAQQRAREYDAAKETLARGITLDPVNGNLRLAYADLLVRGNDEEQAKALDEYERFLQIGGEEDDEARVERTLKSLKKRLASR